MRLIVSGLSGQVVQAMLARAPEHGDEVVAIGRPELDLADPGSIGSALAAVRGDVIVSAAAYTAVDKAEQDSDAAFAVNATGAGALAEAASDLGIPIVHLSTDYVFDGRKSQPYTEGDPTAPLGVYGASKLAGEQAVMAASQGNCAILRTAWVYSPFGTNFAKTMLRLAADRDVLSVVGDQFGNPTNALDIADGVMAVARKLARDSSHELRGLFHMTAAGETSWAGFAEAIFATSAELGGPSAVVKAITTAEYPTAASRPANSRLDCTKLAVTHGVRLPVWQASSRGVVAQLLDAGI